MLSISTRSTDDQAPTVSTGIPASMRSAPCRAASVAMRSMLPSPSISTRMLWSPPVWKSRLTRGRRYAAGEQGVGHLSHREAQAGPLRPARLLEARCLQGAGTGKAAGRRRRHVGRRAGDGDLVRQGRRKAGEITDHAARMTFVPAPLLRARVEDQSAAAAPRDDDHPRQPHLHDHLRGRRKPGAAHGLDDLLVDLLPREWIADQQ